MLNLVIKLYYIYNTLLTITIADQNEDALSYHRVRGLYLQAVIFVATIFSGSCFCGDYIFRQLFLWRLYFQAVIFVATILMLAKLRIDIGRIKVRPNEIWEG